MKTLKQAREKRVALNLRVTESFKQNLILAMIRHNETAPIASNLSEFTIYMMKRGMEKKG